LGRCRKAESLGAGHFYPLKQYNEVFAAMFRKNQALAIAGAAIESTRFGDYMRYDLLVRENIGFGKVDSPIDDEKVKTE
jgi:hypothetical protein